MFDHGASARKLAKRLTRSRTYRNSQWTFGGKSDPLVACIWWNELVIHEGRIVREGNSKGDANEWGNRLAAIQGTNEGKNRLRPEDHESAGL